MEPWLSRFVCPRCGARDLVAGDSPEAGAIRCIGCGWLFPRIGEVPCLLRDPANARRQWGAQLAAFDRENERTRDAILAQLAGTRVHRTTRRRLEQLRARLEHHGQRLTTLMNAAGIAVDDGELEAPSVPGEGTLTSYYHQIHRDYGWSPGARDEVAEAIAAVEAGLPTGFMPRSMLVVGAGPARLAYELHRRFDVPLTVALDINPLPFVVARRIFGGETVRLYEFPISPLTSADVAVDRSLRLDGPTTPGFELVFADGLAPPVVPGSFDTVVTPWFIDQIPRDLSTFLTTLHTLLPEGGRWLNFGPLIYHPSHTMLAHRYPADELRTLVSEAGFEIETWRAERLRYMESPAGTQGRTETVLTFVARRRQALVAQPAVAPEFFDDPDRPVPRLSTMAGYEPPHPMFAAVIAAIDGRRSPREIAALLVLRHGLPEPAALGGVQACLREIWRALDGGEDG